MSNPSNRFETCTAIEDDYMEEAPCYCGAIDDVHDSAACRYLRGGKRMRGEVIEDLRQAWYAIEEEESVARYENRVEGDDEPCDCGKVYNIHWTNQCEEPRRYADDSYYKKYNKLLLELVHLDDGPKVLSMEYLETKENDPYDYSFVPF